MRLIDADKIVHYLEYNDEFEDYKTEEQTIFDMVDTLTDEGCEVVDAIPIEWLLDFKARCEKERDACAFRDEWDFMNNYVKLTDKIIEIWRKENEQS